METLKEKVITNTFLPRDTIDGAGVRLKRVFGGHYTAPVTDPFLLLDHFGSDKPEEYLAGFPWHPHRGIETVTYLLEGKVLHEDSEGHKGTIYPNDLQWMTAGSGIFHQEMPRPLDQKDPREMLKNVGLPTSSVGFQLWVNLPSSQKMKVPVYRDIKGQTTPVVKLGDGTSVKIIAGEFHGTEGSFANTGITDIAYLDVVMVPESGFTYIPRKGYTSIIYVVGGSPSVGSPEPMQLRQNAAYVFSRERDAVKIRTEDDKARFILLSGRPIEEPVYWYGPIVMNTRDQIEEAYRDLQNGTFVREKEPVFL
ncbi:pirin family protein [Thermoplasmatales archaeon AK]|nr:pirin family protein [Thermoplasmatales archaeon AK]